MNPSPLLRPYPKFASLTSLLPLPGGNLFPVYSTSTGNFFPFTQSDGRYRVWYTFEPLYSREACLTLLSGAGSSSVIAGVIKSRLNEVLGSFEKQKCENQKNAAIKNLAFIKLIRDSFRNLAAQRMASIICCLPKGGSSERMSCPHSVQKNLPLRVLVHAIG